VNDSAANARATRNQRRLLIALALAAAYMVAEFIGGLLTGSLALLADAGHMLSDVFALTMSVAAIQIARLPPTPQRTYGYQRTEILAALGHGILLVCISVYIFVEAYGRARAPVEIRGAPMLAIAVGGLLVNIASLLILRAGKSENLNVRGAWLHVMSDALGSVGAITAAALIWAFGWTWADSLASVAIGLMVIYSSGSLLREALGVLMESAPAHIDVEEVRRTMGEHSAVIGVHDLHIWTVGSGMISLSGHVVAQEGCDNGALLREIAELLVVRFEIAHTTIQIEPENFQESSAECCD
jgi:cobalt-zinc-cadmium efflux system protein